MEKKLNILFCVNGFPAPSETFIVNQIVTAIENDMNVTIIANYKNTLNETSQKEIFEKYNLLDKTITTVLPSKNKVNRWLKAVAMAFKSWKTFLYFIKLVNPFKYGFKALNLNSFYACFPFINLEQFDVYHAHFGQNAIGVAFAKELKIIKSKLVTTFHGYDASYLNENEKRILSYNYKYVFKHIDTITTNTPYLKDIVQSLGCNTRIKILPMSVNTAFFVPKDHKKTDDTLHLISVGRLVKFKCHYLGIEAVSRLINKGFKLKYSIIGSGPEHENLANQIEKNLLNEHIKLVSNRSQKEIRTYLQKSDIFLMTSNADKNGRKETQGVVTVEAQACGLPVIAFSSGGVPYTLINNKTGFLAPEKDIDTFTSKLEQLITNEELRKKFGVNAVKFVEDNYSNKSCEAQLLRIYTDDL